MRFLEARSRPRDGDYQSAPPASSSFLRFNQQTPSALASEPPKKHGLGEEFWIELCGRPLPAKNTEDGIRAVVKAKPINPESVQAYLDKSFGDDLEAVQKVMRQLARAFTPKRLAGTAFGLYERFRPQIATGKRGWGQKGTLDLELIPSLSPGG